MKTLKKKGLILAIAAILLVAGLGFISVMAQQPAKDKPKDQERPSLHMLAKDLFNITPEQEKKLQEFREVRMKDFKAFRDQMAKAQTDMRDLMKDPKADETKIDGLIDQTFKLRADQAKTALRQRREMEKIFTPAQLEKIRKYRGFFGGFMGAGFPRFGFMGRPGFRGHGRFGFWWHRISQFMGGRANSRGMHDRGWDRW